MTENDPRDAEPIPTDTADDPSTDAEPVQDTADDPPEAAEFGNVTQAVAEQPEKPVKE